MDGVDFLSPDRGNLVMFKNKNGVIHLTVAVSRDGKLSSETFPAYAPSLRELYCLIEEINPTLRGL